MTPQHLEAVADDPAFHHVLATNPNTPSHVLSKMIPRAKEMAAKHGGTLLKSIEKHPNLSAEDKAAHFTPVKKTRAPRKPKEVKTDEV